MAGFLYFLPNAKQADIPERIDLWGLDYLRDGNRRLHARGATGPGGVHGFVLGSSANWLPEQVKVSKEIAWQPFPKTHADCQAYLGSIEGESVKPEDLVREKTISGEFLTLADGNRWLIPHAQVITDQGAATNLPVSYGLDEDSGDWIVNQILPQYQAIWKHANQYLESMWGAIESHMQSGAPDGEMVSWEIADAEQLIIDALQVNYRVSTRELATLGVLTSDIANRIANVLIDEKGYERLKKKEAADTGAG